MPSAVIAADKLQQLTAAANEEMCRNLDPLEVLEIGMLGVHQLVGEEIRDIAAAVFARRQADGVYHHQINVGVLRAWTKVR